MKVITKTIICFGLLIKTIPAYEQTERSAHIVPKHFGHTNTVKNHRTIITHNDSIISTPCNSLDSMQTIGIITNSLSIPIAARNGWNFAIKAIVKGSKLDTLGFAYYSQGTSCSDVSYTNGLTAMGAYISPEVPDANSFVTGLYWQNSLDFGGNDSAMTWPTTSGTRPGYCINSNGVVFYNKLPSSCADTSYFPVQDIAIYPSLTYDSGQDAMIDYLAGDQLIYPSATFYYWAPGLYMNNNYTLADTLYNPSLADSANRFLATSATVTFDTLFDLYTDFFISPKPGTVKLDTIWAQIEYTNTTGMADTIVFQVCSVDSLGFAHKPDKDHKPATIYGTYTVIIKPSSSPAAIAPIANEGLSVAQNYPNPFSKNTQITYTLAKLSDVNFTVYDMTGRVLINNIYSNTSPGEHTINLSANALSSGVYFYSFNINGVIITKNMVITK